MASAKDLTRVMDADLEVEEAVCRPIRLTPDGSARVAYADDLIDLTEPSWEMADCNLS